MATGVDRRGNSRYDTLFFSGMALFILASVLVGFAPTYYLVGVFKGPPVPNLIVHVHGAVFSLWIVLLLAQTWLIGKGNAELHRRLGMIGFCLACLVVVMGVVVATENLVRLYPTEPGASAVGWKAFYAVALSDILMFSVLIYFACRNRFNPTAHKRLIMIGTLAILDVAIDRWPIHAAWWDDRMTPLVCIYPLLLLLMAYDWWSTGKVQRSSMWASLFLVVVQQGRDPFGHTAAWQGFAAWVYAHSRWMPNG